MNESGRRNRRSKNAEILRALEWRYRPDAAFELAEALQPLLDKLTEEQRATLVELVKIMAKGKRRR